MKRIQKHSPGDWKICVGEVSGAPTLAIMCDGTVVATVHNTMGSFEECLANARLIIAAPLLFQAVMDLCKLTLIETNEEARAEAYTKAQDALSKAMGEP